MDEPFTEMMLKGEQKMNKHKKLILDLYDVCREEYNMALMNPQLYDEEVTDNLKNEMSMVQEILDNFIEIKP